MRLGRPDRARRRPSGGGIVPDTRAEPAGPPDDRALPMTNISSSITYRWGADGRRALREPDPPGGRPPGRLDRPRTRPVVLTQDEVRSLVRELSGASRLMVVLLYGSGLRLLECARLRVSDVAVGRKQITVRAGKRATDRVTPLPAAVRADRKRHLETVGEQHAADLKIGAGWVELPWALARQYPDAGREWPWPWVFPAARPHVDRETGQRRRHHRHPSVRQHRG